MSEYELMTPQELHEFGIKIVYEYVQKDGYEILDINIDLEMHPQIIAKRMVHWHL